MQDVQQGKVWYNPIYIKFKINEEKNKAIKIDDIFVYKIFTNKKGYRNCDKLQDGERMTEKMLKACFVPTS